MREVARPGLSFMLAIGAALAAPACLARQAVPTEPVDAVEAQATPAGDDAEPRSAFGRVMSIMIAALKQNADAPHAEAPSALARNDQAPAATQPGVHRIQVGAAFRLDPPAVASGSSSPPTTP